MRVPRDVCRKVGRVRLSVVAGLEFMCDRCHILSTFLFIYFLHFYSLNMNLFEGVGISFEISQNLGANPREIKTHAKVLRNLGSSEVMRKLIQSQPTHLYRNFTKFGSAWLAKSTFGEKFE